MKALLMLLCIFLPALPLSAHPHVFIDAEVNVETRQGRITALESQWVFDEMFSAMVLMDYDTNRNGRIDAGEITALRKDYFDYLGKSSFFTFVKSGKNTIKFAGAVDFMPNVTGGRLSYVFRLEMPQAVPAVGADILVYDPSYYSSVKIIRASISGDSGKELAAGIGVFPAVRYYFGQVSPDAVTIRNKK